MSHPVEMRCPLDHRRLFGKVDAKKASLEFACRDCRKRIGAKLVIHVFDETGGCTMTREYR